MVTGYVAIWQF